MDWKVGDWAIFDLDIVQIKELREAGSAEVSDGSFCTSGLLLDRLRPLTLRNKRIIEYFDFYYNELRRINGDAGFNYPDISRHFCNLAIQAMDSEADNKAPFDAAKEFVEQAKGYKPIIQGVGLFRRHLG